MFGYDGGRNMVVFKSTGCIIQIMLIEYHKVFNLYYCIPIDFQMKWLKFDLTSDIKVKVMCLSQIVSSFGRDCWCTTMSLISP